MASKQIEESEGLECVLFEPERFEPSIVEAVSNALGPGDIESIDQAADLDAPTRPRRVILYRQGGSVEALTELLEYVRRTDHAESVVSVVDDGDWRAANAALRDGAADYLFVDQFDTPHLASTLRASVERAFADDRETKLQRELEARSSELLGVNALASGVSSSLDREVITRRGLWIFAGVCEQSAVALLEFDPLPEIPHVPRETDHQEPTLKCTASFSSGGIDDIFGRVEFDDSWRDVLLENDTAVLDKRPEGGGFPGLEPFWQAHPEGRVTILPLQANRRPYGALVLAAPEGGEPDRRIGRQGLEAMAFQFASALENARLFEEVSEAYESLQKTQDQLVHAEKFAAVGLLAAEIAHEINNPASFVISNLSVMVEYAETIVEYLDEVERLVDGWDAQLSEQFEALKDDHEIGFLKGDIDKLLSRSLSGMQRIHRVVQDLRYLSRDSDEDPGWIELESLLDATVNLVRHEAKFRANIERDYGQTPQVMSDASRLSQVFLNLLVNAVHAIDSGDVEDDRVRVSTEALETAVRVTIADTGEGIAEEIEGRIFDPFFSTKETGEGTGLGLSISRDILRSLGAEIDFETTPGEGTEFYVTIPIRAEKFTRDEDLRESGNCDMPPEEAS